MVLPISFADICLFLSTPNKTGFLIKNDQFCALTLGCFLLLFLKSLSDFLWSIRSNFSMVRHLILPV